MGEPSLKQFYYLLSACFKPGALQQGTIRLYVSLPGPCSCSWRFGDGVGSEEIKGTDFVPDPLICCHSAGWADAHVKEMLMERSKWCRTRFGSGLSPSRGVAGPLRGGKAAGEVRLLICMQRTHPVLYFSISTKDVEFSRSCSCLPRSYIYIDWLSTPCETRTNVNVTPLWQRYSGPVAVSAWLFTNL